MFSFVVSSVVAKDCGVCLCGGDRLRVFGVCFFLDAGGILAGMSIGEWC
jgi:hypothetical protein